MAMALIDWNNGLLGGRPLGSLFESMSREIIDDERHHSLHVTVNWRCNLFSATSQSSQRSVRVMTRQLFEFIWESLLNSIDKFIFREIRTNKWARRMTEEKGKQKRIESTRKRTTKNSRNFQKNKKFEMKLKIVAIGRRRIDCWWTGASLRCILDALGALGALGACGKCLFSFVCLAEANLVDWNRNEFIVFFFSTIYFFPFFCREICWACAVACECKHLKCI